MKKRLGNNHLIIAVLDKGAFAGIIEVRNYYHISLLFVKKEYHHLGIATRLLELAVNKCRKRDANTELIELNSSPFAVGIYEKLGFVKTNSEQIVNGIRFTLMIIK